MLREKTIDHLYRLATNYAHIEEMAVEDAATPDEVERLAGRPSAEFPKECIYRSKTSPVIGIHIGPRVLVLSVLGDRE